MATIINPKRHKAVPLNECPRPEDIIDWNRCSIDNPQCPNKSVVCVSEITKEFRNGTEIWEPNSHLCAPCYREIWGTE